MNDFPDQGRPGAGDPLGHELAVLASLMPERADRTDRVLALARRRRHRRTAARTGAGVLLTGAMVGGLVLARSSRPDGDGPVGASATQTATQTATATATTATPAPCVVGGPGVAPDGRPGKPGLVIGGSSGSAVDEQGAGGAETWVKTLGRVTAVSADSLTVALAPALADGTTSLTAAIGAETQFSDGATALSSRPTIEVGANVILGARTGADGTTVATMIVLDPPELGPAPAPSGAPFPTKVDGEVVAAADGTVTVRVADGGLTPGDVVHVQLGPGTVWYDAGGQCAGGQAAPGDRMRVVLGEPAADGTYPARSVDVGVVDAAPANVTEPAVTPPSNAG